jgi:amino acid transporter
MAKRDLTKNDDGHLLGTFGGVFTPSLLTILGVIMFMRAGFVVGQAGILGAVLILLLAKAITLTTSFSIAAISSNMRTRGGGAYFMISRVLGPEFGGGIGVALFFAQALSIPFYLLGFTEALVATFPALAGHEQLIGFSCAFSLFVISYLGATWAVRAQYIILGLLGLSIVVFLGGAARMFSLDLFLANWEPGYLWTDPTRPEKGSFTFWMLFAIYFPAVTGIMAGVNMSGDLKDPVRSITRGTLWAVGVGFLVYLLQILLCGGAFPREDLVAKPYATLHDHALMGLGFAVTGGVFAATLSSALTSMLGAPRILQAVGRDRILPVLSPFATGTAGTDEPRRAILLTFAMTGAVLAWANSHGEGDGLNAVASVITMFFLYTYGMTNMAAFIESIGGNPSFRPTFRFFHWSTAIVGALGCAGAAFLINPFAAAAAMCVVGAMLWYLRNRELKAAFGDARRGFVYASVRRNLLRLARMEEDPKNWRPTILVFAGNPDTREDLVRYADWLESGRGIVYLADILVGTIEEHGHHRRTALRRLEEFCRDRDIQAFPVSVVAENREEGVSFLLQCSVVGPMRPNLAMFGWSSDTTKVSTFSRQVRTAAEMGMSVVLLKNGSAPVPRRKKRIDIWWRGHKNGSLMVILAYLLTRNWEWDRTSVRILRVIEDEAGRQPAVEALQQLIDAARIEATAEALVSAAPFPEILRRHSGDATCTFLGIEAKAIGEDGEWHRVYEEMLKDMPTTLIVQSAGEEDMLA